MKESDLALEIIKYLENKGYTSYKEVSMKGKGGNARCDIYFTNDDKTETIAVETKTSMSLKVIEQSYRWRNHANKIYVCCPSVTRKGWKSRKFAHTICKNLGIGVFELSKTGIVEIVKCEENKKAKLPPLYEEQKNSIAGNDDSEFFTSFKKTVKNIEEFMLDKNSYIFNDLIKEIDHHYKTDLSAKSSIKKMINQKVIKGFDIIKENNKITIKKN